MNVQNNILYSYVDGRIIVLEGITRSQFRDLHYQEETAIAKKILALPPFSQERKVLMDEGHYLVKILEAGYKGNSKRYSWGATTQSINILEKIIKSRIKKTNKRQIVYEAGVGTGYAINKIINISNIYYFGCDASLQKETEELEKKYTNLTLRKNVLYDDLLLMKDNSIDIFYADNVIEHILPDESKKIFDLLYKKMKSGGVLFMIIPNRLMGPHDISKYFLKKGSKATGFHFMEMSYGETICKFLKSGFRPNYIFSKDKIVEKDKWYLKNLKRIITEFFISKINNEVICQELFKKDFYNVYILSK